MICESSKMIEYYKYVNEFYKLKFKISLIKYIIYLNYHLKL